MEIKVDNLEIFWSNGSYETPINFPDISKFTTFTNPNVVLASIDAGTVVLKGHWTYAWYRNNFYFLEKLESKDLDKEVFKYSMIRDLNYAMFKCDDLVLEGELVKCTDRNTLDENRSYVRGLDINPIDIEFARLENITKNKPIEIIEHNFTDEQFQRVITDDAWETFDSQLKAIPNPNDKKPKDAILATLITTPVENWKYTIVYQYLKPLLERLKHDKSRFTLTKIDTYQPLNGNFQLTDQDVILGSYHIPLSHLSKLDFSELKDIVPLTTDTLTQYRNKKIGDLVYIPKGKEAVRGYMDGAVFYPDDKPWENKEPTSLGKGFPLDNKHFGVNNKLEFVQLSRAYEGTFKVHLDVSTADLLKSKKSTLEEIDRIIIRRNRDWDGTSKGFHAYPGNQGVFYKFNLPTADDFEFYGNKFAMISPIHWFAYGFGITARDLGSVYKMEGGLPKKSDETFDYEKIAEWITKGKLEIWNDGNIFYQLRHVMFGFSERSTNGDTKKIPYIISFRDHAFAERFYTLLKSVYVEVKATDQKLKKESFLRGVYKRLGYNILQDEYYYIDNRELSTGIHLYDLSGTNYLLFIKDRKTSLIVKDINKDEASDYVDVYQGDIGTNDIYQDINTRKILVTFNKESELPTHENEIRDLKVRRMSPSNKLNIQENILIDYSSKYSRMLELFPIPLRTHDLKISETFDPVSYENYLIHYRKTKEELDLMNQSRQVSRDKENYEYGYQRGELAIQHQRRLMAGIGAILGGSLGSIVKGVGLAAGYRKASIQDRHIKSLLPPSHLYTIESMGSQILGLPATAAMTARSIFTLKEDLDNIRRQKGHIDELNDFTLANRIVENTTFDNKHYWLDYDSKKSMERITKTTVSTLYNTRDVIDEYSKLNKVDEIYVRLHKPNQEQIHMINEHYSQYGVDTNIPRYVLTWKDVRDKINVWGFKYIKWVNIKDPVLKNFVYGKFINGVKLIKPTFS